LSAQRIECLVSCADASWHERPHRTSCSIGNTSATQWVCYERTWAVNAPSSKSIPSGHWWTAWYLATNRSERSSHCYRGGTSRACNIRCSLKKLYAIWWLQSYSNSVQRFTVTRDVSSCSLINHCSSSIAETFRRLRMQILQTSFQPRYWIRNRGMYCWSKVQWIISPFSQQCHSYETLWQKYTHTSNRPCWSRHAIRHISSVYGYCWSRLVAQSSAAIHSISPCLVPFLYLSNRTCIVSISKGQSATITAKCVGYTVTVMDIFSVPSRSLTASKSLTTEPKLEKVILVLHAAWTDGWKLNGAWRLR
jgi:hypothetical protein